jgi:hypothetical protein
MAQALIEELLRLGVASGDGWCRLLMPDIKVGCFAAGRAECSELRRETQKIREE